MKKFLSGFWKSEHKQKTWNVSDKFGRTYVIRTDAMSPYSRYIITFLEGDKRPWEIQFDHQDLRLLRELLNLMGPDEFGKEEEEK